VAYCDARACSHVILDFFKQFWNSYVGFIRFSSDIAGNFSLHRVQNGSGAHPASYPMGTMGSFPGSKADGGGGVEADQSPPTSAEVKEWVELCLHSPNTPSWRGAYLKHRDNFAFTFTFLSYIIVCGMG
jgi:hypothetical protein